MEDLKLPETDHVSAGDVGADPDKVEERTVMRNIKEMLREEHELYVNLSRGLQLGCWIRTPICTTMI